MNDRWSSEVQLHYDVTKVLEQHARGVDRKDWDLVLAAYHEDAVDNHGAFAGSPREFVEYMAGRMEFIDVMMHFNGNTLLLEIDPRERTVLAETHCVGWQVLRDDAPQMPPLFSHPAESAAGVSAMGVRYVDLLTERDGRLRILRRTVVHEWADVSPSRGPEFFAGKIRGIRSREDFSYQPDH